MHACRKVLENGKEKYYGHAWVVDGVIDPNSPNCANIHIVYGNGTYNNGWYYNSIFLNHEATDIMPYVYETEIIYNIRPNPSNPGATSTVKP
ncbi:MAG: hypothetical protein LBV72_13850 [Tannerella sp.]|jgi:hypothetical protein|nr:hypothetical protein [Tannerella sp.]